MSFRVRSVLGALTLAVLGCSRQTEHSGRMLTPAQRDEVLARARVWRAPSTPIGKADLGRNPAPTDGFKDTEDVTCRFVVESVGGTTPKFHCRLPSGDVLKVKYGASNMEIPAEVAATRLLEALGFYADRMYRVHAVRCVGCPPFPFEALQCIEKTGAEGTCLRGAEAGRAVEFSPAAIERPRPGRKVEATPDQGWAWFELDRVDASRGGASRAEVDALRLVAIALAHWDNKSENQRLLCPLEAGATVEACQAPVAVVQDVGATFGPLKIDLLNWRRVPVWSEPGGCRVSMKALPFEGGTFGEHAISEEGRQLALTLLRQLSSDQLRALFVGSGITMFEHVLAEAREPDHWVAAFIAKVNEIAAAGPCPSAATLAARGQ
jgi:hypothetical protein